jgi:hypothetical protein
MFSCCSDSDWLRSTGPSEGASVIEWQASVSTGCLNYTMPEREGRAYDVEREQEMKANRLNILRGIRVRLASLCL